MNSNTQRQALGFAQGMTLGKDRADRASSLGKKNDAATSRCTVARARRCKCCERRGRTQKKKAARGRLYRINQALVRDQPMAAGSSPPKPKVIAQMTANTAKFPEASNHPAFSNPIMSHSPQVVCR